MCACIFLLGCARCTGRSYDLVIDSGDLPAVVALRKAGTNLNLDTLLPLTEGRKSGRPRSSATWRKLNQIVGSAIQLFRKKRKNSQCTLSYRIALQRLRISALYGVTKE